MYLHSFRHRGTNRSRSNWIITELSHLPDLKKIENCFHKGSADDIFIIFHFFIQSDHNNLKQIGVSEIQKCFTDFFSEDFDSFEESPFQLFEEEEEKNLLSYLRFIRYLNQLIKNQEHSFLDVKQKESLSGAIQEFFKRLSAEKIQKSIKEHFNLSEKFI